MNKPTLFSRDFILVIIGQIISLFGATILKFALSLYVLDLTGRADIFAAILAVSTLPVVFLSPIAGAFADRFNRRNLMVIFDFCNCGIVLFFFLSLQGRVAGVVLIGAVMTLLSIISTMYQPTVQASIPVLVAPEGLIQANGMASGVTALTGILGPILGGVLYSFAGLRVILIVSGISFFLSAIMEIFIRIPFVRREQVGSMVASIGSDIKEGIGYILKKNPFILKVMLLSAGLNLFIVPLFLVGIPYIIKIVMGSSDIMFGFANGAISFSSILGAVLIGVIAAKMKLETLYLWLVVSGALVIPMAIAVLPSVLATGFWIPFLLFTICAMLVFLASTVTSIFMVTLIQKETPNALLGKVMAILFASATCATPLGQILYGSLLDAFSDKVYIPVLLAAIVTLLLAFASKRILCGVHTEKSV